MSGQIQQQNKDNDQSGPATQFQIQSDGESTLKFVDQRPGAVAQRKLQEIANNSPRLNQVAQLQSMMDNRSNKEQQPIQRQENNTGLPDNLKSGMEKLSGHSLMMFGSIVIPINLLNYKLMRMRRERTST